MPILAPRRCVACGGRRANELYSGLVRCTDCGMVYYPRRVSADETARLYAGDYFRGAEYFDYLHDRAAHEANFRARLRQLGRWIPRGQRIFEIGCAYGLFLSLARRRWRVRGCDIAPEPAHHARERLRLDVACADFLQLPLRPGEVDAFCLWDTIEHLEDPESYLARVADILPPGGILTLTTGDIGSWLARRQGPNWRQIHPPTHLWYFSQATLGRTLERFGLEPIWWRHVGMWRSVGQMVYGLTSLGRQEPAAVHRLCMRLGLGSWAVWLNTFDLLMVVARRRAGPNQVRKEAA